MRTYRFPSDKSILFAFEIENAYIRPGKIAKLLASVNGVRNVRTGRNLSSSESRVEFEFLGNEFIVWEPFGDSSRYWIGPKQEQQTSDISVLEKVFKDYKPPLLVKIFGDLITLNFKSLFGNS